MSRSITPPLDWTYEDYARLPDDGNRYEILDGEILVSPGPSTTHQHVSTNLLLLLRPFVQERDLGVVLPDVDLIFEKGQYLRPDLVFVPASRRAGVTERGVECVPGLVVEILSPTSGSIDQVKKPRRYADFGVPQYWVVDRFRQAIWVHDLAGGETEPSRVDNHLYWRPEGAKAPLSVKVADVLAVF